MTIWTVASRFNVFPARNGKKGLSPYVTVTDTESPTTAFAQAIVDGFDGGPDGYVFGFVRRHVTFGSEVNVTNPPTAADFAALQATRQVVPPIVLWSVTMTEARAPSRAALMTLILEKSATPKSAMPHSISRKIGMTKQNSTKAWPRLRERPLDDLGFVLNTESDRRFTSAWPCGRRRRPSGPSIDRIWLSPIGGVGWSKSLEMLVLVAGD